MAAALPFITAAVGIYGAVKGAKGTPSPAQAQQQADPFAALRPFFQDQMMGFLPNVLNPTYKDIESNPAYIFQRDQANAAAGNATRSMVGSERSGALPQAIAANTAGLASQYTAQQDQRNLAILGLLGNFAGAGSNPASGAQAALQAAGMNTNNANNIYGNIGAGLGLIGPMLPTFGGNGNSGSGASTTVDGTTWGGA